MIIFKPNFSHLKNVGFSAAIITTLLVIGCDDSFTSNSKPKEQENKFAINKSNDGDDSNHNSSTDRPEDFASLIERVSNLQKRGAQGLEAIEILNDAIKLSPKQTAEWVSALPPGSNKDACLEVAFKLWAEEAPKDAAQFAKNHLKGVDYRLALASVIEGAATSSQETATDLISSENEPLMRGALIDALITGAINNNSGFLINWIGSLPQGDDRDSALSSIVKEWSSKNPVECEKWFTLKLTPEEKTEHAVTLITNWASINPREACAWLDSQPSSELKNSATIALLESWAFVDPNTASRWASGLKDPILKRSALETISAAWIVNDPSGAIDWASKLPDTNLQQMALQSAFESLAGESPSALKYWIQQNPNHPAQIFAKKALTQE